MVEHTGDFVCSGACPAGTTNTRRGNCKGRSGPLHKSACPDRCILTVGFYICGEYQGFDAHRSAAFWTNEGVDFIDTLDGSASSPQISIAQVFDIVFLSGISEIAVVTSAESS